MRSLHRLVIPAAVGASLLLAACGGSAQNPSPPASPSASQSAPSTGGLTVGTATGSLGTYLTGASGRALYIWVADSRGKSACFGACAKAWPPLTVSTMPNVTGGARAADISLIARSGGTRQVAYQGRPLYYYAGDSGAGSTNGQGSNQFGAKWWLISPTGGTVNTSSGSSTGAYGGSSGSSSGGGGWGG